MPKKRKYTRRVTKESTPAETVKPANGSSRGTHSALGAPYNLDLMGHNLVFQVGLHKQARLIFNSNYTMEDVRRLSWSLQSFLNAIDEEEKSKLTKETLSVPKTAPPSEADRGGVFS